MKRGWMILAAMAICLPAYADEQSGNVAPLPSFPSSPAFDALGANPTTIMRPSSPRELGTDILSTLGPDGKFKTGIALEAAPLWIMFGQPITLSNWRADYTSRLLSRTTLSLASAAQATDGVTGLAEGLKVVLWDDSDPRFDVEFEHCLSAALKPTEAPQPPSSAKAAESESDVVIGPNRKIASCIGDFQRRHSGNGSGLAFAGAVTEETTGGEPSSAKLRRVNGWGAFALGIGGSCADVGAWGQFVASARYSYDRVLGAHEAAGGMRFRVGTSALGIAVDGSWTPQWLDGQALPKSFVVGSVAEMRVAPNSWFSVTSGGRFGGDEPAAGLFALVNLKIAFTTRSDVTPEPSPLAPARVGTAGVRLNNAH